MNPELTPTGLSWLPLFGLLVGCGRNPHSLCGEVTRESGSIEAGRDAEVALETIEIRAACGAPRSQVDVDDEAAAKVARASSAR